MSRNPSSEALDKPTRVRASDSTRLSRIHTQTSGYCVEGAEDGAARRIASTPGPGRPIPPDRVDRNPGGGEDPSPPGLWSAQSSQSPQPS
ncbi:hypothetical protein HPP92_006008 [Vanilla planifolia]|uniref:Uncharacterized protein n=1 Tax=Vanilla planifolia TaxID=51239 RepID=A0A835RT56_VANPL|nr:hypothetical protein HPP92_006008 [Vanilla planifolia]